MVGLLRGRVSTSALLVWRACGYGFQAVTRDTGAEQIKWVHNGQRSGKSLTRGLLGVEHDGKSNVDSKEGDDDDEKDVEQYSGRLQRGLSPETAVLYRVLLCKLSFHSPF